MKPNQPKRRAFLGATSLAAAGAGALLVPQRALAQEKSPSKSAWQPTRHDLDDWLDRPSQHRLVFDTTSPEGVGNALAFAANYIRVNRTDYKVAESDSAVLIVVRHRSTPFGYNDAMWAKYGAPMSQMAKFEDPKTKQPAKANLYNAKDYTEILETRGATFDALTKQGAVFGVCSVATLGMAGLIAKAVGGDAQAINKELIANLLPGARMVPAGIVAVSRAQEHGYTFVSA